MPSDTEETSVATEIIDALQDGEQAALNAVQAFVEAVDESLPKVDGPEDGGRTRIIQSAFEMVDQLVTSSNDFARSIIQTSERAESE